MPRLKGNRCEMGQGGTKRDDWLLRVLPNGRWIRVTFSSWADNFVMENILKSIVEKPHWHEMAKYIQDHPNVRTMSAGQFWARYGGK